LIAGCAGRGGSGDIGAGVIGRTRDGAAGRGWAGMTSFRGAGAAGCAGTGAGGGDGGDDVADDAPVIGTSGSTRTSERSMRTAGIEIVVRGGSTRGSSAITLYMGVGVGVAAGDFAESDVRAAGAGVMTARAATGGAGGTEAACTAPFREFDRTERDTTAGSLERANEAGVTGVMGSIWPMPRTGVSTAGFADANGARVVGIAGVFSTGGGVPMEALLTPAMTRGALPVEPGASVIAGDVTAAGAGVMAELRAG
jgi:hypothetical protein